MNWDEPGVKQYRKRQVSTRLATLEIRKERRNEKEIEDIDRKRRMETKKGNIRRDEEERKWLYRTK